MEPTPQDITNLLSSLIGWITPLIVDAFKRDTWKQSQTLLFGAFVALVIYVGLNALLGALTFPITFSFLVGLLATFTQQQTSYQFLFKDRNQTVVVEKEVIKEVPVVTNTIVAPTPLQSSTDVPIPAAE